jgi:glutamate synthase (NADPH/NADH) small chain
VTDVIEKPKENAVEALSRSVPAIHGAATGKDKYVWCQTPRVDPPKRQVAERVADFGETYRVFDAETAMAQASRCVQCAMPFCVIGCAIGNHIPEWLNLVAEGKFLEAAASSCSTSNMPEICSRICPQERLCEGMCALNERTDPIPIGAIEQFVNDYALNHALAHARPVRPNGRKVAVVGSGPAGLSCADELAKLGYAVTVFESQSRAGGLLVHGIPSFKLPKDIVARRVALIQKRGVTLRTGVTVGREVALENLLQDFNAVFLGMGAQKAKPLDIPGADLAGVYQALPFLIEKNLGPAANRPPVAVEDRRVAVLGGGDSAMDCLRTAIRCRAREARCLYRRDLANMPGSHKEYKNAIEEGAQFSFLTNPVELIANDAGQVKEVRCERMELGEPDTHGRRKPRPVPNSEFTVTADVVLVAYGFDPVIFPPENDLSRIRVNEWGGMVVDENLMTSVARVFAGGDQVRGANLAGFAVRDGRQAAQAIHAFLSQSK